MRQISDAYRNIIESDSLEPVFVAKLINDEATVYITSAPVTISDPGTEQLQGKVSAANFNSQNIKPEKGMSSVGNMALTFADADDAFATILNTIEGADGSIINDKVELYFGDASIDFDDYVPITPLYVRSFSSNETSYTLNLTDTQRITQKSLFADPFKTELVGSYAYQDASSIEVISTNGSVLVEHGSDWAVDPSETVGYLYVDGLTQDGREAREVISYTGRTSTDFTGVQRARFGTPRVDLSATNDNDDAVTVELVEFVYIDLVQPLMVQALLTGDYGIVGESLPDRWNAGLDASLVNTTSIANIGGDLYEEHIEFRGIETEDAKEFIANQCLAPYGTFLRIDQQGQYELARYSYVYGGSPGVATLDYSNLVNAGTTKRDAQNIKNFFQLQWEWRIGQEGYYARNDFYIDGNSQTKFKVESPLEVIQLRGLRNRDKSSKVSLDFVSQSVLKRYSNPAVTRQVTAKLADVIEVEVGELITLVAANETDYRTLEEYRETFEVQGIGFDFMRGTATLKLFASEGEPSEFDVQYGSNVVSLSTAGAINLGFGTYGTVSGSTFTFDVGANLPSGKYYFDGDVAFPAGTVTGNGSVYIDADNIHFNSGAKLDGKGRGSLSGNGYFGTTSRGQSGILVYDPGIFSPRNAYIRNNAEVLTVGRGSLSLPDVVRVEDGGVIPGLPSRLDGLKGAQGGSTSLAVSGTEVGSPGANVPGGAGFFFSCTSFTYASDAELDVSGSDGDAGGYYESSLGGGTVYYYHGSSGFGWPGTVIVAMKDRGAAKPFLTDIVTAKTGNFIVDIVGPILPLPQFVWWGPNGDWRFKSGIGNSLATTKGVSENANKELNSSVTHVMNLVVADDHIPEPGVDPIESAPAPTFTEVRYDNEPRTAQGDQVTYEITAESNSLTKYVKFEYRLTGGQWNPCEYKTRFESTLQLTATGEEIELRATAYSFDTTAGGTTSATITLPLVNRNSDESDGGETDPSEDITVPPIKRLELVNRIDNDDNWNQWKSPNAEFRWAKLSQTAGGSITQLNGAVDLHLEGYKIRVSKTDGTILREELVKDSFYVYTFDKNKKDTGGSPVREFKFEVQAVSTTGYVSDYTGFLVENPAPAAPAGVVFNPGFTSIEAVFTLPTDVDFVGVDAYIIAGAGNPYADGEVKRVSGNSIVWDGLTSGQTYTIGLRSVDQFGTGGQTTAAGVTTNLIESSALGNITTPVVIDENGGRLITNNSGYIAFHGATDVPAESPNPLIFGAYDGASYPFWTDAAGDFSFGLGDSKLTFKSGSLRLGRSATFDGNDSYESDLLYRNIDRHDNHLAEANYTIGVSTFNSGDATRLESAAVPNDSGYFAIRPSLYSYGFTNFNKECRLKFQMNFAGSTNNDDLFQVMIGDTVSTLQGTILLQFRCTGTSRQYAVRSAVRKPSDSFLTMPDSSTPVGAYSSEKSISLIGSGIDSTICAVEIVYIPSPSNRQDGKLLIYVDDVLQDELSYDNEPFTMYNSDFSDHLPLFGDSVSPISEVNELPYFKFNLIDSGSASAVTSYILGNVKFMSAEV